MDALQARKLWCQQPWDIWSGEGTSTSGVHHYGWIHRNEGKQCSAEYAQLAEQHAGECAKTFEEYEADMERYKILRDVGETGLPQKGDEREDNGLYFCY
ncbi:hypothetical protein GN958_ATG04376 [Phytophthora infestans]|uniref:Uncharacterized protein n=1 Tax=Phytophthora infestans TaxID=4787 RepID=A0A8S9V2Z7_PHYIN|nr:hypothetical protein GN958_ATG04376 [Phytophthora infestans]